MIFFSLWCHILLAMKRSRQKVLESSLSDCCATKISSFRYFLLKSEPELSIDVVDAAIGKVATWNGVRNYQARNIMKEMKIGDKCLFYHTYLKKATGIYGIVEITRESYPDETSMDPKGKYYDPKATLDKWVSVDFKLLEKWDAPVLLEDIKKDVKDNVPSQLKDMMLIKQSRLSTQRVTLAEWNHILSMKGKLNGESAPQSIDYREREINIKKIRK